MVRQARAFRPPYHLPSRALRQKKKISETLLGAEWGLIYERAFSAPPHSCTLGIIEADKFVDNVLIALGYEGETMADRMIKISKEKYPSVEGLWRAHKVRNEIAHAPDFSITQNEAEKLLSDYEKFLKEFGAISK